MKSIQCINRVDFIGIEVDQCVFNSENQFVKGNTFSKVCTCLQLTKAVVAKQETLQSTFDELFAAEKFAETQRRFRKLSPALHDNSQFPAVHS